MQGVVYPRTSEVRMSRFWFFTLALVASGFVLLSGTEASAQKMYTGKWTAESFGNDLVGGSNESQYFSAFGMPQGVLCNPYQPKCPMSSTPVDATGNFNPLGPNCANLSLFPPGTRPVKGGTVTKGVPPLYRNPLFFTAGLLPKTTSCTATTTISSAKATHYLAPGDPARGVVMDGAPVSGSGSAATTGPDPVAFSFPAAPATPAPGAGMFRTTVGEFNNIPPYLYSYTYATLRNDAGAFGRGQGFFSTGAVVNTATFKNKAGGTTVATINVKRGANEFGGVMKLLGNLTTKVCYFYASGCALGTGKWLYQSIGASAIKNKAGSVVSAPYTVTTMFSYYNTALQTISKYDVVATRFPWTTGTVTVSATGRGPHNTVEVRKGFDNRVSGVGTVQLVSPILTQWLGPSPAQQFETGGIAVLNLQFVPEPSVLVGLVAGLSLLGVIYRFRA